ncbi:MAG: DUF4359 domain-containing protein [Cyanobacteria bacterium]|nr:DUF4359 domain-containing protein [Cyanobacteriota bacterium]
MVAGPLVRLLSLLSVPFPALVMGALAASVAAAGLVLTNPGPAAFEDFAADRLVDLLTRDLCDEGGLPMMMRVVVSDCPGLVRSQRTPLGAWARQGTIRRNFGLFSLYSTNLGGQQLAQWQIPRYKATTLAAAGRFVVIRTGRQQGLEP